MRKILLVTILLLVGVVGASAQTTIVTGTVRDANGNVYSNGTVSAFINLPAGQPIPAGVPASGSIGPSAITAAGTFSVVVSSPFSWTFGICGIPINLGPRGNPSPNSVCFTTNPIAISGTSQDITSNFVNVPILGVGSSAGGAPTKWINITTAPYNAVGDARDFNCGTTNTLPNVTSSGLFLASDVGKEIYIYSTAGGNGFTVGTILSVTDTSNVVISGNAIITTTLQCHIGTNNGPAFIAAAAALSTNQAIYIPGGIYMIDCRQILSNGGLASGIGPVEVFGDGSRASDIWFPPYCPIWNGSSTTKVIEGGNAQTYWHDFGYRPGPEQANVITNGSLGAIASLYGNRADRIRFDNWNSPGPPVTYCFVSGTDGTRVTEPESNGCAGGINLLWKTITILNPHISATVNGIRLFDQSDVVSGGEVAGSACGFLANFQGAPADMTLYNVFASASGVGGSAYCGSDSGTIVRISGGRYVGFGANGNGITLSSGAIAYVHNVSIGSVGTGFGINNSGNFYDLGGIKFESTGAGNYTGTGTVNGKSMLSGTAYTNATTSFTSVTGGSGEAFSFNVFAGESLNATCYIVWQGSAATTGPKFQWTGPASPTSVAASMHSPVTAATYIDATVTAFSTPMADSGTITTATNFNAVLTLGVVNGVNAGTINLQAAANGAGTLTIQPGSYCQSQ